MSWGRPKGAYLEDRQLKPHGTNAARARHRYRGEPYCDTCANRPVNRHYAAKPAGQGWKQNTTKGKAEPYTRPVWRVCSECGVRGQVNSKLHVPKEGFRCAECR
jgi:hypothetical protein